VTSYLLQENGSRILLESGDGFLILEGGEIVPPDTHDAWSPEAIRRYRRQLEALRQAEDQPDTRAEIRRQLSALFRPEQAEAVPPDVVRSAMTVRRQIARPMVDYRPALAALDRMEAAMAAYQAFLAEEDDIEVLLLI